MPKVTNQKKKVVELYYHGSKRGVVFVTEESVELGVWCREVYTKTMIFFSQISDRNDSIVLFVSSGCSSCTQ